MKSSRPLHKLFEEAHDDLAILITRTHQLTRWTTLLRSLLDEELAQHCYISTIENVALTVYVDSAAWATRLRFQVPQLIPQLRNVNPVFSKLERVHVKVLTQSSPVTVQPLHATGPTMNSENANGINNLSNSIDDPALRQALQHLARNARPK